MDLLAAVPEDAPIVLAPGRWAAIPTGLALEIPENHEAQLRPRSGLALDHGLTCLNAPGTIDSDYRGEIKAILINHGPASVSILRGMRIAQLVIAPIIQVELVERPRLTETARAAGGFGSTGKSSPDDTEADR